MFGLPITHYCIIFAHINKEYGSGFQDEYTHETIVAFDGTKFVRVEASESKNFAPPGSHDFSTSSPQPITEEEYNKFAEGKEISDSPEALKALEDRRILREQQNAASQELDKITPLCPRCRQKLVSRRGKHGRFWGCRSYPECKGTAQFTAEQNKLYEIAVGKQPPR